MTRLVLVALALFPLTAGSGAAWERSDMTPGSQKEGAAICGDAVRLARLARINESPDAEMVRTQADVWCAAKEPRPSLTWGNKRNARLPSGAWNYPNGRTAKSSSGVWEYPNGRTARTSSGTWHYPDGRRAKFESGRWQLPDGKSVTESELMLWACQRLGEGNCRRPLAEIRALSGFDRDLAIVELAWAAR